MRTGYRRAIFSTAVTVIIWLTAIYIALLWTPGRLHLTVVLTGAGFMALGVLSTFVDAWAVAWVKRPPTDAELRKHFPAPGDDR